MSMRGIQEVIQSKDHGIWGCYLPRVFVDHPNATICILKVLATVEFNEVNFDGSAGPNAAGARFVI